MISLLIIDMGYVVFIVLGCKDSEKYSILKEKDTFFIIFLLLFFIFHFFFVPLHPLFSCDGELSQ
jgi:hypothetical protein